MARTGGNGKKMDMKKLVEAEDRGKKCWRTQVVLKKMCEKKNQYNVGEKLMAKKQSKRVKMDTQTREMGAYAQLWGKK